MAKPQQPKAMNRPGVGPLGILLDKVERRLREQGSSVSRVIAQNASRADSTKRYSRGRYDQARLHNGPLSDDFFDELINILPKSEQWSLIQEKREADSARKLRKNLNRISGFDLYNLFPEGRFANFDALRLGQSREIVGALVEAVRMSDGERVALLNALALYRSFLQKLPTQLRSGEARDLLNIAYQVFHMSGRLNDVDVLEFLAKSLQETVLKRIIGASVEKHICLRIIYSAAASSIRYAMSYSPVGKVAAEAIKNLEDATTEAEAIVGDTDLADDYPAMYLGNETTFISLINAHAQVGLDDGDISSLFHKQSDFVEHMRGRRVSAVRLDDAYEKGGSNNLGITDILASRLISRRMPSINLLPLGGKCNILFDPSRAIQMINSALQGVDPEDQSDLTGVANLMLLKSECLLCAYALDRGTSKYDDYLEAKIIAYQNLDSIGIGHKISRLDNLEKFMGSERLILSFQRDSKRPL